MFKNISPDYNPSHGVIVMRDSKLQSSIKDGVAITELVDFDDDYSSVPPLIRPEDFTLEKQLKAGVQLNRVNVSDLLNPTDPAKVQALDESRFSKDFDILQHETKSSSPTVELTAEPTE